MVEQKEKLYEVYLGLGSNIGNRMDYLKKMKALIGVSVGEISKESFVYETQPWGYEDEKMFLNQVVLIRTVKDPMSLLKSLQKIEKELGRKKKSKQIYEGRTADIDILFYENELITEPDLLVPHPLLSERLFVLIPFSDINPGYKHPIFNKSIVELIKECQDKSVVVRYNHKLA